MASSPQPVPISSTRVPSPTSVWSSSRSILRACASASDSLSALGRRGLQVVAAVGHRGVVERRGVAQRLVEEQLEQVVGQVVVVRDVARVLSSVFLCARRRAAHVRRAQLLQRSGDQGRQLGGQHGEEAAEVLGVPGAGQVGLAEADQAVAAEPGVELRRVAGSASPVRRCPTCVVDVAALADGDGQPADGGAEEPARDPAETSALRPEGTVSSPGQAVAGRDGGRRHVRRLPVAGGRDAGGSRGGGPTARCRGRG